MISLRRASYPSVLSCFTTVDFSRVKQRRRMDTHFSPPTLVRWMELPYFASKNEVSLHRYPKISPVRLENRTMTGHEMAKISSL